MFQHTVYFISGLYIGIEMLSGQRLGMNAMYDEFRASGHLPDIRVQIYAEKEIIEVPGRLIYENDLYRVIQQDDRIFCYRGNYGEPEYYKDIREAGVCCQQYSLLDKGHYASELLCSSEADPQFTERYIFGCAGLPHILADFRRVILHSSFLAYKGKAILYTAPSGTGKSTQAELWRVHRPGAEIVNGDRSVLSCDGGQPYAHGIPLCGTSGITKNRSMPVRAIIVLRQGPENRIRRLGAREAFTMLFSECSVALWSREDTGTVTDLLIGIISSVPVYLYACRPDASAVDDLEAALDLAQ